MYVPLPNFLLLLVDELLIKWILSSTYSNVFTIHNVLQQPSNSLNALYTEPTCTYNCDDKMTELKKQLKTEQEQKDDMTQDIDIIKTRQGMESKALEYLQLVPVIL